jgi:hypothetical protein
MCVVRVSFGGCMRARVRVCVFFYRCSGRLCDRHARRSHTATSGSTPTSAVSLSSTSASTTTPAASAPAAPVAAAGAGGACRCVRLCVGMCVEYSTLQARARGGRMACRACQQKRTRWYRRDVTLVTRTQSLRWVCDL